MDLGHVMAAVPVGEYISVWKAVPVLVLLLIWARLLTWVDKDAPAAHLPREGFNLGLLSGLVLAVALFLILPIFWLAFGVFLMVMLIEAGTYLFIRHQKVGLQDLKQQFRDWLKSLRGKEKEVQAGIDPIQLIDANGRIMPAPLAEAPERIGYDAIQSYLADPLYKGAEQLEITPGEGGASVKFYVDGVSYSAGAIERGSSAAAITLLKQAAGLDVQDKRKPQVGTLKVVVHGKKTELRIQTAGSTAGEQLRLTGNVKKRHELRLEELGLPQDQDDVIRESIAGMQGIVLVAAPAQQGLTSLLYVLLRAHDAFLSHIQTIERDAQADLEGITQNKLPPNASPAEEAKMVSWVASQEPDVVMISKVEDPRTATELIKLAAGGKRVYIGMRAATTFDALAQWRKLVGDDKAAMKRLDLLIAGRVLRKLCRACKAGYAPDPTTLRKLNMDPERVTRLFQARAEPLRDPKGNPIPCEFCHDLRFKGRTGVYETLVITDDVRQTVVGGGSINQLKAVFRKQKGRYIQERALALVEQGETSVQEVLRVLRSGESAGSSSRKAG